MAPKLIQLLLFTIATSGCAYGYAGKEAKRRSEREYKSNVKVVTIKEAPDEPDEPDPPKPTEPESACGRPTFEIFFYTSTSQLTKTVDCDKRTVVDTQNTTIHEAAYAEAQSAGLPEAVWYLLVDPKGARPNYLNNAQLLKLSRGFSIDYYGRDAARDLLVYLYQQEDVR